VGDRDVGGARRRKPPRLGRVHHAGVDGGRIAVPALHAGAPTTKLAEAARRHDRAYRESLRARFGVTADPA